MKDIVKVLAEKKIILKKSEIVDSKILKTRKKIKILRGVDTKSNYVVVFNIERKSRFVSKDTLELEEMFDKLVELSGHNYKRKILIYKMPMCSKAKDILKGEKWRLIELY